MRKLWKILLGVFSVGLITGIVLIVISNQNKSKPGPGGGSSPGPSSKTSCDEIRNKCDPGFTCVNGECKPTACSPACETGEFCYNGFCVPCTCKGLTCDKNIILPVECGASAGETCDSDRNSNGCLNEFKPENMNLIKSFYPFLKKQITWNNHVDNINEYKNKDFELAKVFSDIDDQNLESGLIIKINNQVGFSDSKIQAGFFKICNIALQVCNNDVGVFVYQYSPFKSGGGTGYVCICSYAFTLPANKDIPTYIQATCKDDVDTKGNPLPGSCVLASSPSSVAPKNFPSITGIFENSKPLPKFDSQTQIYYSANLYATSGSPEKTCVADTSYENELGVYLIGDENEMISLGLCNQTPQKSGECGKIGDQKSDGNYFNQIVGKCICNNCTPAIFVNGKWSTSSSKCETSPPWNAGEGMVPTIVQITDTSWWGKNKTCSTCRCDRQCPSGYMCSNYENQSKGKCIKQKFGRGADGGDTCITGGTICGFCNECCHETDVVGIIPKCNDANSDC